METSQQAIEKENSVHEKNQKNRFFFSLLVHLTTLMSTYYMVVRVLPPGLTVMSFQVSERETLPCGAQSSCSLWLARARAEGAWGNPPDKVFQIKA